MTGGVLVLDLSLEDVGDGLEATVGATSQVALVYPDRRLLKPAVRAFVDFVVESLDTQPLW